MPGPVEQRGHEERHDGRRDGPGAVRAARPDNRHARGRVEPQCQHQPEWTELRPQLEAVASVRSGWRRRPADARWSRPGSPPRPRPPQDGRARSAQRPPRHLRGCGSGHRAARPPRLSAGRTVIASTTSSAAQTATATAATAREVGWRTWRGSVPRATAARTRHHTTGASTSTASATSARPTSPPVCALGAGPPIAASMIAPEATTHPTAASAAAREARSVVTGQTAAATRSTAASAMPVRLSVSASTPPASAAAAAAGRARRSAAPAISRSRKGSADTMSSASAGGYSKLPPARHAPSSRSASGSSRSTTPSSPSAPDATATPATISAIRRGPAR